MAFFDPCKLFNSDGSLKLITEIDDQSAASIAGFEVCKLFDGTGDPLEGPAPKSDFTLLLNSSVIPVFVNSKPLPQIAQELGVDGIVEGTVLRAGDRVRIASQLIYAPLDQHLWAHSY